MQPHLNNQTDLSRAIMRRVYWVYLLKHIFSPFGIKVVTATALAGLGSVLVSMPAVIYNALAHRTPVEMFNFFFNALTGTTLVIKLITLALFVCAVLMVWDVVRIVRMMREKKTSPLHSFHKLS